MTSAIFVELRFSAKEKHTCDIVETLYDAGHKIILYVADKNKANKLNLMLWSWKQETFIPHSLHTPGEAHFDPVILFTDPPPPLPERTLILFDPLPEEACRGYRLVIDFAEVYNEQKRQQARQRYKTMRDSGRFTLQFMTLGAFLAQKKAR